jgi:hypothetical protein
MEGWGWSLSGPASHVRQLSRQAAPFPGCRRRMVLDVARRGRGLPTPVAPRALAADQRMVRNVLGVTRLPSSPAGSGEGLSRTRPVGGVDRCFGGDHGCRTYHRSAVPSTASTAHNQQALELEVPRVKNPDAPATLLSPLLGPLATLPRRIFEDRVGAAGGGLAPGPPRGRTR